MPRFKDISKTNNNVRLHIGDKQKIKDLVKEFRHVDKRFENEGAAIRYFVHVGISAQTSTEDLKNSLDNTIVKKSIKEAVRYELSFHSEKLENMQDFVKKFETKQNQNLQSILGKMESIESRLINGFDQTEKTITDVLNLLETGYGTTEKAFRNIIVLRTVMYIFLLGHRTGRIEPGEDNIKKWYSIIRYAHEEANALSVEEIKRMPDQNFEAEIIEQMASSVFKKINSLPKTEMSFRK